MPLPPLSLSDASPMPPLGLSDASTTSSATGAVNFGGFSFGGSGSDKGQTLLIGGLVLGGLVLLMLARKKG